MRVLLVVHGFPPAANGGTEIYTRALAHALTELGEEVAILSRAREPVGVEYSLRREETDGLTVFSINHTFAAARGFEDTYRCAPVRRRMARVLDEWRPDVVHVQHLTCLSADFLEECAARSMTTVMTLNDYWMICHRGQLLDLDLERCAGPLPGGCSRCLGAAAAGPAAYRAARSWRILRRRLPALAALGGRLLVRETGGAEETLLRARFLRRMLDLPDLLLAPSRALRERFIEFGVPAGRLRLQEQGIDLRPFAGLSRPPGDRLRIGFLGSLMASKAPHLLLEAWAGLPAERIAQAELQIFGDHVPYHGDDRYRALLLALLRLPGVVHRGAVPHEDVPRVLAELDLVVVPSIWLENAPFVIREAFASRVPVLASRLGGMEELVTDGRSGLLFAPGDAADLRRCLLRMLEEPGLAERLRGGIPAMLDIRADARRTREIYAECAGALPHRGARSRPPMKLAAVVLNCGTPEDSLLAARSLQASQRKVDQIWVVDNGSDDRSVEYLRRHLPVDGENEREGEAAILEAGRNLGFSAGCNLGLRRALATGADLILLLNSDVVLPPDALGRLEGALATQPEAGIVGPLILSRADPGLVGSAGMTFAPRSGRMRHLGTGTRVGDWDRSAVASVAGVAGCALLVRREVLEEIGLFTDEYFFSFEDLDFCLRAAAAGWQTLCVPSVAAYHEGGRTIGARSPARLYYAARNHLLLTRRFGRPQGPVANAARTVCVIGFNLAHALLGGGGPRLAGLAAVLRGVRDHWRWRYGPS